MDDLDCFDTDQTMRIRTLIDIEMFVFGVPLRHAFHFVVH